MFLNRALPAQGRYCAVTVSRGNFRHKFFESLEDAEEYLLEKDAQGHTVYIAQATFREPTRRNADNALALRSFFLDIDCGEDKPYPSQREGAIALKQMVEAAGLPEPIVTSSGRGLYAHWPMNHDIPKSQWVKVAQVLKQVCPAYGLQADPARTSDAASILRPPGSTNRKPGQPPRTVTVLNKDLPQYDLRDFVARLARAANRQQIKTNVASAPKADSDDAWSQFSVYEEIPSDPHKIADRCAQLAVMRDRQGNIPEPQWYACIGLLRHTVGGEEIIHEWSSGHPDYTEDETDAKISQHEQSGVGPTTCTYFASLQPDNCLGCRYKDKVKSPILLGRPEPEPLPAPTEEEVEPPPPFLRTKEGIFLQDGDVQFKVYDLDIYPISISFDESLGYEVTVIRHRLPHDGWHEFTIRSSVVNDSRGLLTALWDNHVHITGKKEKNLMCAYLEGYMQRLQRKRKLGRLMNQMGWKEINGSRAFVLGTKIFNSDGSVDQVALANNIPTAAQAYHCKGELADWVHTTDVFNEEDTEPYAFALLAGAFGAPLMKFTGYEGAMVSLVGQSGIGKTLVTRWAQSVYGKQDELMMLRDDTRNSLVARLGVYGSLPLTIDEITNIDPAELSDLVYRITQGRDKARLTKNAVERASLNHWNTIALVSSNASLLDKLSGHKSDASAEMNRVFEYSLQRCDALDRPTCTAIYRTITENYGHAGEIFVAELVKNTDVHQAKIDQIAAHIEKETGADSNDRFWAAMVAASIYGGSIAQRLGLIQFDVRRVLTWAISQIRQMRDCRSEMTDDPITLLGMFLDDYTGNRLVVEVGRDPRNVSAVLDYPHGKSLVYRLEEDKYRLFISRSKFRDWMGRRYASFSTWRSAMIANGSLINANKRKLLGAGTAYAGTLQPCLEINLKTPALGYVAAALVEETKLLKDLSKTKENCR